MFLALLYPAWLILLQLLTGVEYVLLWIIRFWFIAIIAIPAYIFQKRFLAQAKAIEESARSKAARWYFDGEDFIHVKSSRDIYQIRLLGLKNLTYLEAWLNHGTYTPLEIQISADQSLKDRLQASFCYEPDRDWKDPYEEEREEPEEEVQTSSTESVEENIPVVPQVDEREQYVPQEPPLPRSAELMVDQGERAFAALRAVGGNPIAKRMGEATIKRFDSLDQAEAWTIDHKDDIWGMEAWQLPTGEAFVYVVTGKK
jgi:hypothetical protein